MFDPDGVPELIRPLVTHHVARRFRATEPELARTTLYPHEVVRQARAEFDFALRHLPKT